MAASRHTRKRTNASVKAKKFPPPASTKSVIDEVAISKNGIKLNEEKRDGMPSCEEVLDLKHHGNDKPNGNALENRSIPLIHANGTAKNVNANLPLSPPKSLKVPLSYTNNIQPSPQQAANEWTRQQQQQQYHAPSSVAGVFPPSFQQQQQQQQQMMQMMMSSGMMDPSSAAAMFVQYNNNYGGPGTAGGGRGVPSANHQQNLLLMGNPIHDFLQMQQNPTAFPTRYLINAQNGPFPFPWPPVGMPPFPTIPAGMSARHQIENAAGTTTATQRVTKPGEGDHGQQNIDKNDKNEDITDEANNATGAAKVTKTELEKDQQQNEKETTTQLVENGSGLSSDNFQMTTTAANNTFGSVSNGKKTVTRVLPTEEQLEYRQRYLQRQQQLNQFNAFNALQQSGAAYSAYAAALSMGQPDIDPPSFAAQRAFQQHQEQQQHFYNMMNNNFNSNQHHHQQQMYLHHQQQQQTQQQQQQQHEYQQQPSLQPTTTTTQKKGKQGVSKSNRNRLVWNDELHKRFMNAVNHLGLDAAVPKTIMQMMNVEGLTRENVASHLQKYRLKQMTAEEKAAMNANIAMKKNASLSTMDGSNYTGDGKELLNGNAPNRKGASLKRPAGTETETLEGTKKSKMQNEGDANVATAPIEVNATPTANPIGGTSAAAQDGKDSGESSDERDAGNNSGGENNFQNPPQHESNPKENEQQQQELHKKQQRSKRGKSSSDDEASDKDNFGQQHRFVVGS